MFTKVFEQIFDSSIAEDYRIRHVFTDLLVLADSKGHVDKTPEAIARQTNVPLEIVKMALQALESPDERSRSKAEDGRRIVRLDQHRDWGWRIVNYVHYRNMRTEASRRDYWRNYKAEQRRKRKKVKVTEPPPPEQAPVQPDLGLSVQPKPSRRPTVDEVYAEAIRIELPREQVDLFWDHYESNGWKVGKVQMVSWKHALSGWKQRWKKSGGDKGISPSAQALLDKSELDRLEKRISQITNSVESHQDLSPEEWQERKRLKDRAAEIRKKLGWSA